MTWEFHSHTIAWELQCMGMENYQFLKSVVGIMLPQQTLIILSEMLQLHLAYLGSFPQQQIFVVAGLWPPCSRGPSSLLTMFLFLRKC